jgi:hypothetical protein
VTRFIRTPEDDIVNVDLIEVFLVRGHFSQHKLKARLASGNYVTIGVFDTEEQAYAYALAMQNGPPALFEEQTVLTPASGVGDVVLEHLADLTAEQGKQYASGRVWP